MSWNAQCWRPAGGNQRVELLGPTLFHDGFGSSRPPYAEEPEPCGSDWLAIMQDWEQGHDYVELRATPGAVCGLLPSGRVECLNYYGVTTADYATYPYDLDEAVNDWAIVPSGALYAGACGLDDEGVLSCADLTVGSPLSVAMIEMQGQTFGSFFAGDYAICGGKVGGGLVCALDERYSKCDFCDTVYEAGDYR